MKKKELYKDQKFYRLLIIDNNPISKRVGKDKVLRDYYKCRCDCGTEKYISKNGLLYSGVKSCGCLHKEHAIKIGKAQRTERGYFNFLYGNKRRSCKHVDRDFLISLDDFITISKQPCFYCNEEPKLRSSKFNKIVGIAVPVNTIDRIDSKKGYIKENCVAACDQCNIMKMNYSVDDLLKKVKQIYEYKNLNFKLET